MFAGGGGRGAVHLYGCVVTFSPDQHLQTSRMDGAGHGASLLHTYGVSPSVCLLPPFFFFPLIIVSLPPAASGSCVSQFFSTSSVSAFPPPLRKSDFAHTWRLSKLFTCQRSPGRFPLQKKITPIISKNHSEGGHWREPKNNTPTQAPPLFLFPSSHPHPC